MHDLMNTRSLTNDPDQCARVLSFLFQPELDRLDRSKYSKGSATKGNSARPPAVVTPDAHAHCNRSVRSSKIP